MASATVPLAERDILTFFFALKLCLFAILVLLQLPYVCRDVRFNGVRKARAVRTKYEFRARTCLRKSNIDE